MANENALLKQCYVLQSSHAKITIFSDIKGVQILLIIMSQKEFKRVLQGMGKFHVSNVTLKFILSFVSQAHGS